MKIEELIDKGDLTAQLVREALNILLEAPYFYKTDDERLFLVVLRYKQAFAAFFEKFFGWTLVTDGKCARLYKPQWFNEAVTPPNRDMFGFTKRDESIAFLLLLEFFERESRDQEVTTDDPENLRFRFGDWLDYAARRFRALLPAKADAYTDEKVRQILRGIMPALEKYRFLRKVKASADENVNEAATIFECLPAMWHYQAVELATPLMPSSVGSEDDGQEGSEVSA